MLIPSFYSKWNRIVEEKLLPPPLLTFQRKVIHLSLQYPKQFQPVVDKKCCQQQQNETERFYRSDISRTSQEGPGFIHKEYYDYL